MHISRRARIAITTAAIIGGSFTASHPAIAHDNHGSVTVHVGQSIQAALDAAAPGATVKVDAGAYAENLVITKPVHLDAEGVVLNPPAVANPGFCTDDGYVAAICATGDFDFDADGNIVVKHYLTGVEIDGIHIRYASGPGIFSLVTDGLAIQQTIIDHTGGPGIWAVHAKNALVHRNEVGNNNFGPGIDIGSSPDSHSSITDNLTYNNFFGIDVHDSIDVSVAGNNAFGNCVGILVSDEDRRTSGDKVEVYLNIVHDNNAPWCPANGPIPALQGIGILIGGADNVFVHENVINGHSVIPGVANSGSAVVIEDSSFTGGSVPVGNTVTDNRITDAGTAVAWDGTGTGNSVSANHCHKVIGRDACDTLIDDGDDADGN